jgi:hypothetical protein
VDRQARRIRELGAEQQVALGARGHEQPRVDVAAVRSAVAQHRHQRDEPGAAADQQQRPAVLDAPGEVPADRAAQLELIARFQHARQIRRDLAVVDPLDGQREPALLGAGPDRVGALRLVAVGRGQADVDVLAGDVARPVREVEHDRDRVRVLLHDLGDRADPPRDGVGREQGAHGRSGAASARGTSASRACSFARSSSGS